MQSLAVIGGGAWGTALAVHLARCGHGVGLWLHESEIVTRIREHRDNPIYLPGISIPETVRADERIDAVLAVAEIAVAAIPAQHARSVYRAMAPYLAPNVPLAVATKGIEERSLALPLAVAREELGARQPLAVLSGPSFAREVAEGRPTALVLAAANDALTGRLQQALTSPTLRCYTSRDPVGVQVAGALKNVIAIAAGMADGLGLGANAVAALITRGLAETTRLGIALGGHADTFSGLAGLGDLVLTCTGDLSRNRTVGRRLGRGERLQDILAGCRAIAEGVTTTRSARALAARAQVEMPIVEEVYRILYEDGSPVSALARLMRRPLPAEESHTSEPMR